jgi:hypothetical protein
VVDEGRVSQKSKAKSKAKCVCGRSPLTLGFEFGVRKARTAVDLITPVHRLYFLLTSGGVRRGLFEHVAAQQIVRVPQPRLFVKNRGNPAGAVNRGRLLPPA